ncbi:hypothetical protein [Mangrovibrevibacter kandeliae]|uniref:hypothetical protein n=1 Tax=Mangrovibrevibacter kandeliae TaxID=2968473 RepID=UPI002118FA26|nr:hypothetical protein [Aurantimonas sp. CSK15Z-1]MCQ8781667.1 hypothetical protein [Aurantimonas sp. CSK15Z-1]
MTDYRVDDWTWWQTAVENPQRVMDGTLPVHDGEPMTGFYRTTTEKGGEYKPVAFWYVGGALQAAVDGKVASEDFARSIWTHACKRPVSHEAYLAKTEKGVWPDEVVAEIKGERQSLQAKPKTEPAPKRPVRQPSAEPNPRAVIGNNAGPAESAEFQQLKDEIDEWRRRLDKELKDGDPADEDSASRVSDIGTKLSELERQADQMRVAEKQPFLDGGREIDAKFKPLTNMAEDGKRKAKRAVTPYLQKKTAEEQERLRQEDAQRQQERRLDDAAGSRREPKAQVGNRKAVSLVKRKVAVIDDPVTLATFMLTKCDPPLPDLIEVIRTAALRMLKAGVAVTGAHLEEIEEAR